MIKWSANLSILFKDIPFLDRFKAAADAGFHAVEFWWPSGIEPDALVRTKQASGLKVILFNIDAGDMTRGDRGFANDPDLQKWWRDRVEVALDLAKRLDVNYINALAGNKISTLSYADMTKCLCDNLKWATKLAEEIDVALLLEPLNPIDNPLYLVNRISEAVALIERVDRPNIRLQLDVYHTQRTEGNLVELIRTNIENIRHIQIADCPGRAQPGSGEINWRFVLHQIEALGYSGFIGLEYNPLPETLASLTWLPQDKRWECKAEELNL